MNEVQFILYVANQEKSKIFYEKLLRINPSLDVPGMVEFKLTDFVKLGLMSESGIAKIINDKMPNPNRGSGIPRCELYLKVNDANDYLLRGTELGGIAIDELKSRDWGDVVGYISDLDGHVIAFAENESVL